MIQNQLDKRVSEDIRSRNKLEEWVRVISEQCIECSVCVKQCAFLKRYGTPKKIADSWSYRDPDMTVKPFACSLCSLCTAVCPEKIDPKRMFLEMRRYAATGKRVDFARQKPLINYERRGTSRRYSFYGLPAGCDIVFFPGCALAGSRPKRVMQVFEHLQNHFPNLGIVLDCCTKPSHDLGRDAQFHAMFTEMHRYLETHGVKTVLVACPSCHVVFKQYSRNLAIRSVYEILAREYWQPETFAAAKSVTVQDSCVARFDKELHASARRLVRARGITYEEMKHHGKRTLCCGEGGGAHFVAPDLADSWAGMRRNEVAGRMVITYCAGCAQFLRRVAPTAHLFDVLFEPAATLAGRVKVARPPFTYLNRLLLKRRFKKRMKYGFSRERTFTCST